jgi:hypothetical protein
MDGFPGARGESPDAAAGVREEPGSRRCDRAAVPACAEMGSYYRARATEPGSNGPVELISEGIAGVLKPTQAQITGLRVPVSLRLHSSGANLQDMPRSKLLNSRIIAGPTHLGDEPDKGDQTIRI